MLCLQLGKYKHYLPYLTPTSLTQIYHFSENLSTKKLIKDLKKLRGLIF